MGEAVLEHVWSNLVQICDDQDRSPVARMLSSLLTVPTVCFTSKLDQDGMTACACIAGEEVMPGVSLADVLFEDLEVEVSDDTVIYIESISMNEAKDYSAELLGQTIGNILVKLASPSQPSRQEGTKRDGLVMTPQIHRDQLYFQKGGFVQLAQ